MWSKGCNAIRSSKSAGRSFRDTSSHECHPFPNASNHCWSAVWLWESKPWFRSELHVGLKLLIHHWLTTFSLKGSPLAMFESHVVLKAPDHWKSAVRPLTGTSWQAPEWHPVRSQRTLAGAVELWCDSWDGTSMCLLIYQAASVGEERLWCHILSEYPPVNMEWVCNKAVWSMFKGRSWKSFILLFVEGWKCSASSTAALSC